MPLTCRSWSSVHCDLLVKEEDPWNCFTLVRDTWAGFLFVTVETIKAQFQFTTSFAMQTNSKRCAAKVFMSLLAFQRSKARIYRLKVTFYTQVWNALLSIYSSFPPQPHFPLSQQHRAGSRPLLLCSVFLLPKRNKVVFAFCSGSPVNGPPLLPSGMIQKIKAGLD